MASPGGVARSAGDETAAADPEENGASIAESEESGASNTESEENGAAIAGFVAYEGYADVIKIVAKSTDTTTNDIKE
jgi:hypothetical protein